MTDTTNASSHPPTTAPAPDAAGEPPIILDIASDPVALTAALVDIESPSHHEQAIADALEASLRRHFGALGVELREETAAATQPDGAGPEAAAESLVFSRFGNTLCIRTNRGLASRVILAGHIDTVPLANNVPHRMVHTPEGEVIFGCGTVDMKSGLAVYLHAFATLATSPNLAHDLTFIAYEGEEVSSEYNGLLQVQQRAPHWLDGDLALLGEPSGAIIEAGCQGTVRVRVTASGTRAHSARSWLGDNAAHRLAPLMAKVAEYQPREVPIDGLVYREGLNIVHLESGIATNVIPDSAWMYVNYRFAPDLSVEQAIDHVIEVLGEHEQVSIEVDDAAAAAKPGLNQPAAQALIAAVGGQVRAKYGWTDVARFSAMGTPAVNFGPGDPGFAHKIDEQCPVADIRTVSQALQRYLVGEAETTTPSIAHLPR